MARKKNTHRDNPRQRRQSSAPRPENLRANDPPPPSPAGLGSSFLEGLGPVLLIFAATLLFYAPVAGNGFIRFDDDAHLFNNPQVRQGLTWSTVRWALTSNELANWYPLTRLTHLLDVSLFGMRPGAHHLVSAAWHAAAAGTLFASLRLMTGAAAPSLAVAAVFALHPMQVESVAWAVERSMVLSGFFFALTLLLWTRHARRPGGRRYAAFLAAAALGMLAKPTLVALPFLLLLLDFWPLGRLGPNSAPWRSEASVARRALLELAPPLLLAASLAALTFANQRSLAMEPLATFSMAPRLANAALSYWRYLGKIFWPSGLAVLYPHPGLALPLGKAVAAALALAAATAVLLAQWRRRPWLGVGWLWFVVALVPMIGVVQVGVQAIADRYVYLPLVGVLLAAAWEAWSRSAGRPRLRLVQAGVALAALAALGATTVAQQRRWRDGVTLFEHTLSVTRGNWLIENNLGVELFHLGRHEEAVGHYLRAIAAKPDYADARNNLAISLRSLGRRDEAMIQAREALRLRPADAKFHTDLGNALNESGRLEEAAAAYREAVRLRPDRVDAWFNLGVTLESLRRFDEAAGAYREALRLQPGNTTVRAALQALPAPSGGRPDQR